MARSLLTAVAALVLGFGSAQTTLEFWHSVREPAWSAWIDARIEAFNAELAADGRPYRLVGERKRVDRDILDAAVSAARDGEAPHLLLLSAVHSQRALDSGIVRPPEADEAAWEPFLEPLIEVFTIDGAVNAVPMLGSSLILLANEELMATIGLRELPTTYGDLLDACERLGNEGVDAACVSFPLHGALFEQWIAEQGALLANHGNGREGRATELLLTSEAAMRVGAFVQALGEGGHHGPGGAASSWDAAEAAFVNGASLFLAAPSARVAGVTNAVAGDGSVRAGPLPVPEGVERRGAAFGAAGIWFSAGHPREEAQVALEFALHLTGEEPMAHWHELTGYAPVREGSVARLREAGWFERNPNLAVAVDHLLATAPDQATAGALVGPYLEMRAIIERALERIDAGDVGVEQALMEAKQRADALLAEYNVEFF